MGEAIVLGVMGWFGSTAVTLAAAGTIATVVAGAITGALIGAAIGGLSAAFMGGDIGQGMLYGAIGGAVTGGFSAWLGTTGNAANLAKGTEGSVGSTGGQAATATNSTNLMKSSVNIPTTTPTPTPAGGIFGNATGEIIGHTLQGVAGAVLTPETEGIDYAAQAAAQMDVNQQAQAAAARESVLAGERKLAELEIQTQNQLDVSKQQISEQARQYDVSATAAAARLQDAGTTMGVLTMGQGTDTTATYNPTLKNVLDNELYTNVAGA